MERPSQEIKWNTAMVTIPASPIDNGTCAPHRLMHDSPDRQCQFGQVSPSTARTCGPASALPLYASAQRGREIVLATLHDPRQIERHPCFTVLIAVLIEAEDGSGCASGFYFLAC
jgi:hypothetical protein